MTRIDFVYVIRVCLIFHLMVIVVRQENDNDDDGDDT